ncbi:S-4TM family putative pore-forming effector [Achromobacter deleyi]|uniref:S-4TM family putative pore-forming effector n=1 Tax=Achromobacter deleyi TaxID=1353891 RepID=UPI001468C904|nr:S-4TM family putative pore-forming effector [Achromobacter deleyi]CAB3837568.1 hypothetical protein LMG3412_01075 [Achromobacter deleyi]
MEHSIVVEENKPERIKLLRAQRKIYGRAKLVQHAFAIASLLLPLAALIVVPFDTYWKPYLGFISIGLVLVDSALLAPWLRKTTRNGAKVQEQFDVEVLQLPWNKLAAGTRVDPELVHSKTAKPPTQREIEKFSNWYSASIAQLPTHVGRLLCQRTNIVYDSTVRETYVWILLGFASVLVIVALLIGLHFGLSLPELIVTLLLPTLPLLTFALREWQKHMVVIETLGTLKGEVERLWEKALDGAAADELTRDARALQDALYRNRAGNPLIVDWLYDLLRNRNEASTNHAVDTLVAEAKKKLALEVANEVA